MKLPHPPKGFTLVELLVVISIIAVLASLAVPAVTSAIVKGQLIQAVNNARQIHIATMSMANDGAANSDTTLGWPGDTGVQALSDFANTLVNYDYLQANDLKVFAAAGIAAYSGSFSSTSGSGTLSPTFSGSNSAFFVYKISDSDPGTTVFLSTKNLDYTAPGTAVDSTKKPFGEKGFVICRKGGDVSIYKRQQYSNTNSIGNITTSGSNTGYLQMN